MTPRERWLAAVSGKTPDRVPCDYWGTGEVTGRLLRDLCCRSERELWQKLEVDKCIFLAPRHPRATEDTWHIPSLFSVWGIPTALVPYMDGLGAYEEAVDPPLADAQTTADIERHPWPDPADWDTGTLRAECLEWQGYPIVGASYEPFYLYCRLRGMEQALEDLALGSPIADALMERIYDIHAGISRRALEAAGGLIDFIYVAEDLGTQASLLMSPKTFRRYIKPWLARMIDLAHSYGARAFHHDDGAIRALLPDLIEIGIDVLNPIQWRCRGMDRESLARDFGSAVTFHGAMDNQHTLPFGSPEDVRKEVADNIAFFRGTRGYICSPCHNLQANTPTANIVALYSAVREFGQ
ncbi:MAG TPA: uroporphyrinogen decarboxylase family protein [Bryobacteraceae bacterium]|nr:uroporphyrinogen decarboxylase family protein [Bryobacteraceae bacterium]